MSLFRAKMPLFRAPGTAESRMNTGLFRVFRVFRPDARIRERGFHARAPQKDFSRVYVKVPGTPGTASIHAAFARNGCPEHTRNTRNRTP